MENPSTPTPTGESRITATCHDCGEVIFDGIDGGDLLTQVVRHAPDKGCTGGTFVIRHNRGEEPWAQGK